MPRSWSVKLWRWPGLGLGVWPRRPDGVREGIGRESVLVRLETGVSCVDKASVMMGKVCMDGGNVSGDEGEG